MKLSVSNIAWLATEDDAVLESLLKDEVRWIEIAPTRVWPVPVDVKENEAREWAGDLLRQGLRVSSFQALLFGQPGLMLFGSDEIRRELAEYLKRVIRLAGWLGAGPLVFGSPKNRARGGLTKNAAMEVAAHFFHELGQAAQAAGCCLTIEPNPTEYGCDFVTTMDEAAELVRRVDSPGVRLQLDAGELAMNQEDLVRVITEHFPLIHHVHASEPMLGCLTAGANLEFHREIGHRLRELHYEGFVTIEMKRHEPVEATVRESVRWVREAYGIS